MQAAEKADKLSKQMEKERDHNFYEYQKLFDEYNKLVSENEVARLKYI
jgi:hypothetical protein